MRFVSTPYKDDNHWQSTHRFEVRRKKKVSFFSSLFHNPSLPISIDLTTAAVAVKKGWMNGRWVGKQKGLFSFLTFYLIPVLITLSDHVQCTSTPLRFCNSDFITLNDSSYHGLLLSLFIRVQVLRYWSFCSSRRFRFRTMQAHYNLYKWRIYCFSPLMNQFAKLYKKCQWNRNRI